MPRRQELQTSSATQSPPPGRTALATLDRPALAELQLERLNALLAEVLTHNRFYRERWQGAPRQLASLDELPLLPATTKHDLVAAGADAVRTYPLHEYRRFHQTSGTHGRPWPVYDTAADWQWWINGWQFVLDAAEVTPGDRALLAFSFGPFIGFWSAHDALAARGTLVVPGGGMSTSARLELLERCAATVLCCTPSYALRLAEVAAEQGFDLAGSSVTRIIVAGEPGGSSPPIRGRIEAAWNARVVDHAGATEVGPWGFADAQRTGLHVLESEFVAEFADPQTGRPVGEGELAHLTLTALGRRGMPAIRYRTGDLVRPRWNHDRPCRFVLLEGGVLGRIDDMLIIRGVNVFPAAVEAILRSFPEVVEYRLTARQNGPMDELAIEVEDRLEDPRRLARELDVQLGLRVEVTLAPVGSLPRYEGKGRRFVDRRREA